MHPIFFSAKRAHQRTLASLRDVVEMFNGDAWGLTPARFDMLYAIKREELVCQRGLCRILGVTAATVSRMARSLEELGLISRQRSTVDRRRLDIRLTARGASLFELAIKHALKSFIVEGIARYALRVQLHGDDAKKPIIELRRLLHRMRRRLHDEATNLYPWTFPSVRPRFQHPMLS